MTREEAIAKVRPSFSLVSGNGLSLGAFVDSLVALGLLKLEEKKSAWDKFKEVMVGFLGCEDDPYSTLNEIKRSLAKANLSIVEKQHGE